MFPDPASRAPFFGILQESRRDWHLRRRDTDKQTPGREAHPHGSRRTPLRRDSWLQLAQVVDSWRSGYLRNSRTEV